MKIHSIQQSHIRRTSILRRATGLAKACCAVVLCSSLCSQAQAQLNASAFGPSQSSSASNKIGGIVSHGEQSYRVVSAADYTSSTDIRQSAANTIAQAGLFLERGGCNSNCDSACSTCDGFGNGLGCSGGCAGSCGSCGGYGASSGGYGGVNGGYGGGMSCPTCESYWYGSIEALSMERTGSRRFSNSPDFFLTEFDYEWAPRVTIGAVPDCVRGYEFSFTGQFEWDRVGRQIDPTGGIGTLLIAIPPVTPADLSAFDNAVEKAQFYTAEYWSLEMSNTMVGWDVAKLLCGVRYINYDELFLEFSRNATESGFLRSDVENQMAGFQVGVDLLYPICHRTYTDLRARAGVYANFIDLNFQVVNAGTTTAVLLDEDIKLAGQLEIGSGIRYEFSEAFSIRGGFEVWYVDGVASARDQFSGGILANRTVRSKDDFTVIGFNIGADFRY